MTKGNLTREEAIQEVGLEAVQQVESANCDFTNRVQTDGDPNVEFSASVPCMDAEGETCTLTAYYYQDPDDLDRAENLDELEWQIAGYEIV